MVGAVCDRYGPYVSLVSGALVAALAFVLLGLFQSFTLFLLAYGLLAAYALAAMTFVPLGVWIDSVVRDRHKGLEYLMETPVLALNSRCRCRGETRWSRASPATDSGSR